MAKALTRSNGGGDRTIDVGWISFHLHHPWEGPIVRGFARAASVCAVVLLPGLGWAVPVTQVLLDGSSLPGDQGWSTMTTAAYLDASSDGSSITVNTVGVPSSNPGPFNDGPILLFYRDLDFLPGTPYEIETTLQVLQSSGGAYSSGVTLYGTYGGPQGGFAGVGRDRELYVFLGTNQVAWGDFSQTIAFDTTDAFHTYLLSIDPSGLATLSIDGVPALSRTDFQISRLRVAFGDNTNGSGVDGRYRISNVTAVGEVPEPSVASLLVLGLVLLSVAARRSSGGRARRAHG